MSEILFVPEVFRPEDKEGISICRAAALKGVKATGSGQRKLKLVVAEVKEISAARKGRGSSFGTYLFR